MTDLVTVIDGSAIFAILLDEPEALRCETALRSGGRLILSAGSLAEMLIVAAGKGRSGDLDSVLAILNPEIIPLTADRARAAADAYRRWGKGFHPAALNLGDSFAYALAIEHRCPLLYVGDDFAKTDVTGALT